MIQFDIPITTVSESNQWEHWRSRAKRVKSQRSAARLFSLAFAKKLKASPQSVTMTRISPRRLDTGNLSSSMKNVQDGVCDALRFNDGDCRIVWNYRQEKGKPPRVRVKIET